ncbi:hypothetical protein ACJJID_11575 [Microbulbifer sp. CnH-101-G]|uniref:hypothetical protein n=1 Tax=Microbulbifer sp. CnH-101-G TaxID=3243393 RepID=UPI0040394ED8
MGVERAKRVLTENSKVLYGIFGIVELSGYFPPHNFLNQFLMQGNDPCDQDGRMDNWPPFKLSSREYNLVKDWWCSINPGTVVDDLGEESWSDWAVEIIERE